MICLFQLRWVNLQWSFFLKTPSDWIWWFDSLPAKQKNNLPSLKVTVFALKNGGFNNRDLLFQASIFRSELLVSGKVPKIILRYADPNLVGYLPSSLPILVHLLGGWTNPSQKYESNCIISSNSKKQKCLKPSSYLGNHQTSKQQKTDSLRYVA